MTLARRGRVLWALLALPLLCLPAPLRASGFALEMQGARAMGLGGASVAQTSDPSAIHYNAAAVAFLKGKQVYVGGLVAGASTDFAGAGPFPPKDTSEKAGQSLGPLATFYYSQQVGEKTVFGIGVEQPFAFKNEWDAADKAGSGRFYCMSCELRSWAINPTAAVKLADRLAVGGGLDLRLSRFNLRQRVVSQSDPVKDIADLTVDSSTAVVVGFNFGVLAQPSEDVSIGLAYRHKVDVTHDATGAFTQVLTGDQAFDAAVAASLPKSQLAEVGATYPATIAAGIAWRGNRVRVEGDLVRTLWASLENVVVRFRSSAYDTTLPLDFTAAWTMAVGAEYEVRDDVTVRGGYTYETSPQPLATLSPFLNDTRRLGVSLGGSYTRQALRVDGAVRLLVGGSRQTDGKNRYAYEGTYSPNTSFAAGLSIGYRF